MKSYLLKINQLVAKYYEKYNELPNAILISREELTLVEFLVTTSYVQPIKEKTFSHFCGLKIIPIKYGEMQVVEVE